MALVRTRHAQETGCGVLHSHTHKHRIPSKTVNTHTHSVRNATINIRTPLKTHTDRQSLTECRETEATILVLFRSSLGFTGGQSQKRNLLGPRMEDITLDSLRTPILIFILIVLPIPSRLNFPLSPSYYFLCAGVYLLSNICSHLDCGLPPLACVPTAATTLEEKQALNKRNKKARNSVTERNGTGLISNNYAEFKRS